MYMYFASNWNGQLLNDNVPFIRPASDNLKEGTELAIIFKKNEKEHALGYARIVYLQELRFGKITDGLAYTIIGNNAHYLRTVLAKMYFKTPSMATPDWIIHFGVFKWEQRVLPTCTELFNSHYKHICKSIVPDVHNPIPNTAFQNHLFHQ